MTKSTYEDCPRKLAIRDELIHIERKRRKVVTMLGPSMWKSAEFLFNKGFSDIISYEIDPEIYAKQVEWLKQQPKFISSHIELRNDNIVKCPIYKGTTYDIDCCCSITSMKEIVKRFRKRAVFTMSLRYNGNNTIGIFFKYRGETIIGKPQRSPNGYRIHIQTNKGMYIIRSYRDTSPMLMISKEC